MRFNPLSQTGTASTPSSASAPAEPVKPASKKKAKQEHVQPALSLNMFLFLANREGVTFSDPEKALRDFTLHYHSQGGDVQQLLGTWLPQFKTNSTATTTAETPTVSTPVPIAEKLGTGKLPHIERTLPDEVKYAAICTCLTSVQNHHLHFSLLEAAAEGKDAVRTAYSIIGIGGGSSPVAWASENKGIVVTLSQDEFGVVPWSEVVAFANENPFIPSTHGFPLFTDEMTVAGVNQCWDHFMQDVENAKAAMAPKIKEVSEKLIAITGKDADSKRLKQGWQRLLNALTAFPEGLHAEAEEKFMLAQQHLDERLLKAATDAGVPDPQDVTMAIMEILTERCHREEYHAHTIGQLLTEEIAAALMSPEGTTDPSVETMDGTIEAITDEVSSPAAPLEIVPPPAPPESEPIRQVVVETHIETVPAWKRMLRQVGYHSGVLVAGSAQPAHI
ncbi:MAG TPA: hypothetical protein VGH19_06905 [Verrucomicrobiae bacterium]